MIYLSKIVLGSKGRTIGYTGGGAMGFLSHFLFHFRDQTIYFSLVDPNKISPRA